MSRFCPTLPLRRAFSLIELLAVLAIVGILTAVTLPMTARSDSFRGNLVTLSGVLDQARQFALARNTPVWVVFAETPDGLQIAAVASLEGADEIVWSGEPVSLGADSELELIGRVRKLSGLALADPADLTVCGAPSESGMQPLGSVHFTITYNGASHVFDRAVRFAPTGEAGVKKPARFVEWGVRPSPAAPGSPNAAVLRLGGITGQLFVYRP